MWFDEGVSSFGVVIRICLHVSSLGASYEYFLHMFFTRFGFSEAWFKIRMRSAITSAKSRSSPNSVAVGYTSESYHEDLGIVCPSCNRTNGRCSTNAESCYVHIEIPPPSYKCKRSILPSLSSNSCDLQTAACCHMSLRRAVTCHCSVLSHVIAACFHVTAAFCHMSPRRGVTCHRGVVYARCDSRC